MTPFLTPSVDHLASIRCPHSHPEPMGAFSGFNTGIERLTHVLTPQIKALLYMKSKRRSNPERLVSNVYPAVPTVLFTIHRMYIINSYYE